LSKILRFRVHYTWILVFALVTAIVTTQFSEDYPLREKIVLGLVVSLLFLAAVTIRELILNMAEFSREFPVRKITLFVIGGIYPEIRESVAAANSRLLYMARFLSNLAIAAVFAGLYATFVATDNLMAAGVAQWLAYLFFLLFLLHIIPAFPLDGGKILRLVLWRSTGDYYKATQIASLIGWAAGLFFIFVGGLVFIVTFEWTISLVVVSIGWIIEIAAGNTRR
jgi:Zn-dependent protease